jgi:hypothetical protein
VLLIILYAGRLSFCTQGDLSNSKHMLRLVCKVSISLKLGWVQFDEVTCEKLHLSCKKEHVLAFAQCPPSGVLKAVASSLSQLGS